MTPQALHQRLTAFPRFHYATYPSPLESLDNLTRRLGGPRLWVKRDDGLGRAFGGNKTRKLEFLMAEIVGQERQKVMTFGGLQSNHARLTAAACARHGLQAHLFFFAPKPGRLEGNLLLNHLLGARLHFFPLFGGGEDGTMTIERANLLVRLLSAVILGPRRAFIPVGGYSVTGGLGYVAAALELHAQITELGLENVTLLLPVGTGGTLAGLAAGFALLNTPIRVIGIDIGKLWKAFPASLASLAEKICAALGEPRPFTPADIPLISADRYVGGGYAKFTTATLAAIQMLAHTQGLLLDPVYTGKACAALLDMVKQGQFREGANLIFLHTGGLPGLWAYTGPLGNGA